MKISEPIADNNYEYVSEFLEKLSPAPPDILYHYSSVDALYGIVSSKAIWASNLHYLNDSQEFKLGIEIARKLLERKKNETIDNNITVLNKLLESLNQFKNTDVFVVSFTEKKDHLSQWREYCPSQGGYSLGFSSKLLQSRAKEHGFKLCRCVYESSKQEQLVQDIINYLLSAEFNDIQISDDENKSQIRLAFFLLHFLPLAPLLKNSSFSDEKEWRLVSLSTPNNKYIKYRPDGSMLVPYFEFNLTEGSQALDLHEVVIGPNLHSELAELSIKEFFKSLFPEKMPKVNVSKSSYRNIY
jgi:hypothetical protein